MSEELSLGERKTVQLVLDQKKEDSRYMGWVEKEDNGKREKRILVIANNKIFTLKGSPGKIPPKTVEEAHYLDLEEIKSKSSRELLLVFKTFKFSMTAESADEIIHAIRSAYADSFPGIPESERYRILVEPETRLKELPENDQPLDGFISTYKSLCVREGVEPIQDIIWDLEHFYNTNRDFNLREFEQSQSPAELRALLETLQYNGYFRSITASDFPLNEKTVIAKLGEALKFNTKIEEITLRKVGLTAYGVNYISESLTFNKTMQLTSLDLSHNNLDDKAVSALSNYIGTMTRGLVKLDLSNCNISKAGMSTLCQSLKRNVHMTSTLTFFDISNNKLDTDGSSKLAAFLASPNSLRYLYISNSAANLDVIMGAIIRGSSELAELDISHNKLAKKDSLVKFLQAGGALKRIDMTDLSLSVEFARDILNAIIANPYLNECEVNLSENKLGLAGAKQIASLAEKISNIVSLDISDNDFGDEGIFNIAEAFCYNKYTKHISFDKNYRGKAKGSKVSNAIEGIINLMNSESPIESVSLAGDKSNKSDFKSDIYPLFQALGNNEKIVYLDVSGNQFGNKGASMLGKALQTNKTLETLKWDNNGVTIPGFEGFLYGLKRNLTLKNMPLPIFDISECLKSSPKAASDISVQYEKLLARNQSPDAQYQGEEVGYTSGNQFGFLSSGEREKVQKLLYKIKATGRKVSDEASVVIEDAQNQDHIMTNIWSLKDQINLQLEDDLKEKLRSNARHVTPIYGTLKGKLIEMIMETVKKSFHCLEDDTVRRLQTVLAFGGKDLEVEDVQRILVEAASSQLEVKARQGFHSLITIASDYLYEKVQDQLQDISDIITHEISEESAQKEEELRQKEIKAKQDTKKKPASKTPSKVPAKKAPETKASPPPKPSENAPKAHVEELPEVKSNITEHATRSRPMVKANRRPPTRKPRATPSSPESGPM